MDVSPEIQAHVKLLSSEDKFIRDASFKKIMSILCNQSKISTDDIVATCKGMHVWLWMQDKPLLHEKICTKICHVPKKLPPASGMCFIRNMFTTEMREWHTIDRWRVDKFTMLVRDFFVASLQFLQSQKWFMVDEFCDVLRQLFTISDTSHNYQALQIVVAEFMLEGMKPFEAEMPTDLAYNIFESAWKSISLIPPTNPVSLVLRKSLLHAMRKEGVFKNLHAPILAELQAMSKSPSIKAANRKLLWKVAEKFKATEQSSTTGSDAD